MGALQRFERRLEDMVGNTFARLFKGRVHPAEIGRALQREADEQKVVVGEGRVLVPNRYAVGLGTSDYEHLAEWEDQLTSTLAEMVQEHIAGEGWSTYGDVLISFECDEELRTGIFEVRSRVDPTPSVRRKPADLAPLPEALVPPPLGVTPASANSASPAAPYAGAPPAVPYASFPPTEQYAQASRPTATRHALVVDGPNTRYPLVEGHNIVGRGHGAQVILPDTGVSRRHVDITVTGGVAVAHDLGSTNGSIVNGHRIAQQQLSDGDVIRVGHSVLVYRMEHG